MAKKPTWTSRGTTHQRTWGPRTLCGLEVPYLIGDKRKKARRIRRRIAKDKKPRPITCIDCLAATEGPTRVLINEPIRGQTAYMTHVDEPMEIK